MRTRLAALLSIAGVLTAGSAAALVNTQVLDSGADGGSTPTAPPATSAATGATAATSGSTLTTVPVSVTVTASVPASSVDATTATVPSPTTGTNIPTTSTSGTTAGSAGTVPSVSSPATAVSSASVPDSSVDDSSGETSATAGPVTGAGQQTYQLGRGGSVTLAVDGDRLTVVAVHPAPGWSVHDAENEGPNQVRVRVRNDDGGDVRLEASLVLGVVNVRLDEDDD